MNKNYFIAIAVIIVVIIILFVNRGLQPVEILQRPISKNSVMFMLTDGDTKKPISKREITICDDSIIYDRVGNEPYKGFCNDQKVWGYATTDQDGKFYFDISNINLSPSIDIMIDPGKEYYPVGISRSDTLSYHNNPSFIRVLNSEKSGIVISNLFYNLDTKEVREVFGDGRPDKTSPFEIVSIIAFKLP